MDTKRVRDIATIIAGAGLIGIGVLFVLGQLLHFDPWRAVWPFFIIVPGLLFFLGMLLGGAKSGGLAVPGTIITTVGLLLLFQSVTGLWATWAYAWSLIFPVSAGVGIAVAGLWDRDATTVRIGTVMAVIGVVVFLVLAAFFEALLNISRLGVGRYFFPALLIAAGVVIVVLALAPRRRTRRAGDGVEVLPPESPQS